MLKIEYEIKLNDNGRPCIDLSEDYENKSEDKFLAIELSRYLLQNVYSNRISDFDLETGKMIEIGIAILGQIGDEMSKLLWKEMKDSGDIYMMLDKPFHVKINSIEDRDKLGKYTVYLGRIFERTIGLKVYVVNQLTVYELKDGISNENWINI